MTKKIIAWISAMVFSFVLLAGAGAQTTDQAAIAQALSAMQGGTGGSLSGSLTGTAPTAASPQPTVNQLTAAPSAQASEAQTPNGQAVGTGQAAGQTTQLSSIEQMFATMASSLGTPAQNLTQFGYSLFGNPTAPSLAAIGDDYTLGPGDGLVLYLWGDPVDIKELSSSYVLTVDRNGSIFLPPVGQVSVWGQDLGTVKDTLKGMLDRRYKRLEMNLTLSSLRQFPVFVSGYAGNPGTVLANGADTVFTVLSRAGGILKTGSLRSVTLTRQGKGGAAERLDIDFYASLLEGKPIDLRVREGDSIFIPGIGSVVALAGELKRPGIYEIKSEASIGQALALAGGALPSVRSGSVSLVRFDAAGKVLRTGDIADKTFAELPAGDGDFVYFGRVSDLLLGQAQVSGAVKYPGRYDVSSFKTLRQLLLKAQPLPETNLFYGRVYRIDPSGRDKSFAFSPKDVLASVGGASDAPLTEFDKVVLYRYDDTAIDPDFDRFADTVVISGPVKYPGFYLYKEGMRLSELLSNNTLLLDTNHSYAELTRRTPEGKQEYYTFSPDSVLAGKTDLALARYDSIRFVRRGEQAAGHDFDKFPDAVTLTGNIARPEVYALMGGMKLSQVVVKDQVLLDTNLNYGEITRLRSDGKNEYVTFRPAEVLSGAWDFELASRDRVNFVKVGYAPERPDFDRFADAVEVRGPVQFGGMYAWKEGMGLRELLALAKPLLEANQYYAEIVRGGENGRNEYLTFAPREVASGAFDLALRAKDIVRLYTNMPVGGVAGKAEGSGTVQGVAPTGDSAGANVPTSTVTSPSAVVPNAAPSSSPLAPGSSVQSGPTTGASVLPLVAQQAPQTVSLTAASQQATVTYGPSDAEKALFNEVVTVSGAVRYTGPYARTPSLKLSSVVTAEQLLDSTNLNYAEMTRLNADGSEEYRTFSPKEVLAGKYDLPLQAKDVIRFVKKTSFGGTGEKPNLEKFSDVVQLTGAIARPEVYALTGGMKLSQVVVKDQVLLDTNLNYGEITRLRSDGKNEYVTFRPAEVLAGSFDLDLGPRDVIRLVKVGYMAPAADAERFGQAVTVEGPVEFAGSYAWREGMGLRELLVLAKPLLETNQVYAEIVRPLGGGKNEYVTFAPREVASGVYDTTLKARDRVRLYTTIAPKIAFTAQGAAEGRMAPGGLEAGQTMMTPGAATGQAGATAAAPVAAPTIAPSAPNGAAGPGATAASAGTAPAAGATSIETDTGLYLEVVYTSGSIRYEGPYARTPSLMLSSVVTSDQILQDTNLDYAELTRRKADGSWEYLTFSPREVLGKTYDIPLRAMDSIHFVPVKYLPEKIDFDKFGNAIAIEGATNFPGLYSFSTPQMLSEILTSDQLLSTTDIFYGEIERWQASGRIGYLTFSPLAVLQGYQDIQIYPRDIIRFVTAGDTGENHDFSKYPDTVLLKGSIRYPGRYAWYKGMKLSDILQESDLLIDTETSYAEVRRYSATSDSIINFAPGQVIARKTEVELQPRDTVFFYPRYYQKPISIAGEVADPKVIPYYDQIELSSVLRSVTLLQSLMDLKAEIKKTTGETTVVYLEDYLKRQPNSKVLLSPGDAITIRTLLPDEHLPVIVVRGQVRQPQTIAFSEGMRLSDALVAAGGYDSTAYPKGLVLIRKSVATAQQTQVDRLIAQLEAATLAGTSLPTSTDTTLNSASAVIANMQIELAIQKAKLGNLKQLYKEGFGRISLEIPDSLEALAGSLSDIRLERDDLIYVPKVPTYVLVSGEVSSQNVVLYREGMTVRQAIAESGWMSGEADLSHAYIIRASGKLDSTEGKGFLFFRPNILNYTLQPGDTVFVPTKSAKVSVAWAYMRDTFVSIGSILTSALTAKTLLGL